MDYQALRDRVVELRNTPIPDGDGKFLVGIIYHFHSTIEDLEDEGCLIWVKANGKTTITKLKKAYLTQQMPDGITMLSTVDLMFDNAPLTDETHIRDLNKYNDRLIVLKANRQALAPVNNRQLTSPKFPVEQAAEPTKDAIRSHLPSQSPTEARSPSVHSRSEAIPNVVGQNIGYSASNGTKPSSPDESAQMPPSTNAVIRRGLETPQLDSPLFEPPFSTSPAVAPPTFGNSMQPEHETRFVIYQRPTQPTEYPSIIKPKNEPSDSAEDSTLGRQSGEPYSDDNTEQTGARSPSPEVEVKEFFTSAEDEMEPESDSVSFESGYLGELMQTYDAKRLEAVVKKGTKVLSDIEFSLRIQADHLDAAVWLTNIETLQKQAKQTRTVVGVVGNTGAGKSSVINALLDEERLVPTNCMRACTAVVTEISWNHDDDPAKKYRAEIDFITEEEWRRELDILFNEMIGENGELSRDTSNPDSEAGVAYAKVKAVYPQMTREEMTKVTIDSLLKFRGIRVNLGTTKKVIASKPEYFYRSLQQYVDSKEKEDNEKDTSGPKKKDGPRKTEWWPLIKSVKIFVKAEALSTGAVLVDLPGVQDSNAARAAVADGYMKQCSGLWIVAPINRAVNDKAAKKLLGDGFKRQMKYDGMFNNVTFICSKTDDISVGEAADSLGIEEEIRGIGSKMKSLVDAMRVLQDENYDRQEREEEMGMAVESSFAEYETWVKLRERMHEGEAVYEPRPKKSQKRKRPAKAKQKPRKRRNIIDDDLDDFIISDEEIESEPELVSDDDEVIIGVPLTADQIKTKLEELKVAKAEARQVRAATNKEIISTKVEIRKIKESIGKLDEKRKAICIAGRNDWSRSRIKDDYAMGIKELDHETAIEEDEEAFDPSVDLKDYDAVAKNLPVFCVSSRAYQTLSGRLEQDGKTKGFETLEQTEMPQLKKHCMKMTEENRAASCKVFLNNLTQMLLSMSIWASNDGTGIKLTDKEHEDERRLLGRRLKELETAFDKAVDSSVKAVKAAQVDHISRLYPAALAVAESKSIPTAQGWGAHQTEGGYYWATYKALVRRLGGPFTNPKGTHDLNKQLSDPLERYLVSGWEKCFQRVMPTVLKSFGRNMSATVKKFHDKVAERARTRGVGIAGLSVLDQKLPIWEQRFNNVASQLNAIMSEKQKEANREITPVISAAMEPVYTACIAETGKGQFVRMKNHMNAHVQQHTSVMFKHATTILDEHLSRMRTTVEEEMENQKEEVFEEIRRDYMNVIAGVQINNETMPRAERDMRAQVYLKVQRASGVFKKFVELGDEYEKDEEEEECSKKSAAEQAEEEAALKDEATAEDIEIDDIASASDEQAAPGTKESDP